MNESNNDIVEVEYTDEDRKQLHRRVFKMISIAGITLVVLIVATYAWFIGITTVSVREFEVQIESLEGLQISTSGENFGNSVTINYDNHDEQYISNNNWVEPGGGLKPVSSTGEFSSTGHLKLYENSSVTAITGGYRLRTAKVKNEISEQDASYTAGTSPEKKQYITFDLFLKNNTNTQPGVQAANRSAYTLDEAEAVYLTTNSIVELVSKDGASPSPTETESPSPSSRQNWIENSVRVGFYQIAYAPLDATLPTLRGMGCESSSSPSPSPTETEEPEPSASPESLGSFVTVCTEAGVRSNRTYSWNIWEPNDLSHKGKALEEYQKLCYERTSGTGNNQYTGTKCNSLGGTSTITDGVYANTYAVNKVIDDNSVNIYDGFNSWTGSIGPTNFLYNTQTLKSSTNVLNQADIYSTDREALIRIAPNSITKVRVYIWLEGQDIDNLDYLQNDLYNLRFSFGLTKDIYEQTLPSPSSSSEATTTPEETTPEETTPEEP